MDRPMLSLIEPVGFWFSSFANSRQPPLSRFFSSTSGVLPIVCRIAPSCAISFSRRHARSLHDNIAVLPANERKPVTEQNPQNLIWIDLEMTGLVPEQQIGRASCRERVWQYV